MRAGMTPISRDDARIVKLAEILGVRFEDALVDFSRWGD
jgi:hypothetical protein